MSSGHRRTGFHLAKYGLATVALGFSLAILTPRITFAQAQPEATPETEAREMELHRYRDAVRRFFVLKQYRELLELTEQYGHLFPEDESTEFYRTQAELRLQEAGKEVPFKRLRDRPFEIPQEDAGGPALLDQLRKGEVISESGPAPETANPFGVRDTGSEVAMGTAPPEPGEATISPFSKTPSEASPESATPPTDEQTVPPAPEVAATNPDLPPPPPPEEAEAAVASSSGSSPLPLILGGAVLVLGAVAAFLLIGMARRGRKEVEAALREVKAPVESGPAPPLFAFDENDTGSELSGEFGDAMPDPFKETVLPEANEMQGDQDFGIDEPVSAVASSPPGFNDTRAADVNQDISDLLYSPGATDAEGSAFSLDQSAPEVPAPLGETQMEASVFDLDEASSGGDNDQSDLVQIPDDSSRSDSGFDADEIFAAATSSRPVSPPSPEKAAQSSGDLSSIDLFGEESSPEKAVEDGTSQIQLDDVASAMGTGGGSSSVELQSPSAAEPPDSGSFEIPFALEDPFQNLSGSKTKDSGNKDDETAFQASTAETLTPGSSDAETGAEERELLEIIEEGGASGVSQPESTSASNPWAQDSGSVDRSGGESAPARSFREDETAHVTFDDVDSASSDLDLDLGPHVASPEAETVAPNAETTESPSTSGDDPFDREYERGQNAIRQEDWDKAVHHLSIAVALRPEAADVRDELRHARKMRKEQRSTNG